MKFSPIRGSILRAVLLAAGLVIAGSSPFTPLANATERPGLPPPAIAAHISLPGVNNFGRVTDHLYRGAQPSKEGFAQLKRLGIGIVVNLRDGRGEPVKEQRTVDTLGLRYVPIPWSPFGVPTDAQVAEFLELIRENPQTTIFVHCREGADRTGVMIAVFRIADDNWTSRQALREMKAFHHHFWLPHLNRYVEHFPTRLETSPELRPLAASR